MLESWCEFVSEDAVGELLTPQICPESTTSGTALRTLSAAWVRWGAAGGAKPSAMGAGSLSSDAGYWSFWQGMAGGGR